eukprot:CAMPEP_0174363386 /NCGR_PEP_ID=MMETSP0811_2-20130205/68654_1 /TAXON_ID=73025 ORGANISM="Eutreptiella gymnastica-like, Strain CCMP1594" /NCGR_SAMPLE_ID=MMETSP0811_2 /ASSEMBLY_ACC=CAM_ASM_000667 /LENGTH=125 /DNA_ID=CAMNT_0015502041 /DNA_START=254 /DNA_END=631 /DNA_ORIENTATION=+
MKPLPGRLGALEFVERHASNFLPMRIAADHLDSVCGGGQGVPLNTQRVKDVPTRHDMPDPRHRAPRAIRRNAHRTGPSIPLNRGASLPTEPPGEGAEEGQQATACRGRRVSHPIPRACGVNGRAR